MSDWPRYYILIDRTPMAVDAMTWAKQFDKRCDHWQVAFDKIDARCNVSTVFLGLDHNFSGRGDPVLFETMIFGGALDDGRWRYCTWADAERGHAEAVAQARIARAKVKAIADAAGAKV